MIGENSVLTDAEQEYVRETLETLRESVFVDELGAEHGRALDRNEESESDWQEYARRMGKADFLGIAVPERYNGAGRGFHAAADREFP